MAILPLIVLLCAQDNDQLVRSWLMQAHQNREKFKQGTVRFRIVYSIGEGGPEQPPKSWKEFAALHAEFLQDGTKRALRRQGDFDALRAGYARFSKKRADGMMMGLLPPTVSSCLTDGASMVEVDHLLSYCSVSAERSNAIGITDTPVDYCSMGINERASFRFRAERLGKAAKDIRTEVVSRRLDGVAADRHVEWIDNSGGNTQWSFSSAHGGAPVRHILRRDGKIQRHLAVNGFEPTNCGAWLASGIRVDSPVEAFGIWQRIEIKDVRIDEAAPAAEAFTLTIPKGVPVGFENPRQPIVRYAEPKQIKLKDLAAFVDEVKKLAEKNGQAEQQKAHSALARYRELTHPPSFVIHWQPIIAGIGLAMGMGLLLVDSPLGRGLRRLIGWTRPARY